MSAALPASAAMVAPAVMAANGTDVWNGASATTNNWSDAANWTAGSVNKPPIPLDALTFDGTARLVSNNDFAAGSNFTNITFNATAGAFTLTGNAFNENVGTASVVTIANNGTNLQTLSLNIGLASQKQIFNANLGDLLFNGNLTGGTGFTKTGNKTVILSGTNTFTGSIQITAGTVRATANTNALGAAAAQVVLGSPLGTGTLQVANDAALNFGSAKVVNVMGLGGGLSSDVTTAGGAAVTHSLGTLNLLGGSLSVTTGSNTAAGGVGGISFVTTSIQPATSSVNVAANASLGLGAIARQAGGTIDFVGAGTVTTSAANGASGILGGYATVRGVEWARNDGSGNVVGGATYTTDFAAGLNTDVTADVTSAATSTGSVRFNASDANHTLTLAGDNVITSGGILVTTNTASRASLITGGTITSGNGQDLVVIHNNVAAAAALTVNSKVTGAIGLTKVGAGRLVLGAANDYTGVTNVFGGTLTASVDGALPTTTVVNLGTNNLGANLDLSASNNSIAGLNVWARNGTSTVTIGAGKTLTLTGGGTNVLNVGPAPYDSANQQSTSVNSTNTGLRFTGGGNLAVTNSTAIIIVSGSNGITNNPSLIENATLDLSGLANFTANVAEMRIGAPAGTASVNVHYNQSQVTLAANNNITAKAISIGSSQQGNANVLSLGTGSNVLNVGLIQLAATNGRSPGTVNFASAASGSLVLRGLAGGSSRANINLQAPSISGTAGNITATFDVSGTNHTVDLLVDVLDVVDMTNAGAGQRLGVFAMGPGTLDVNTIKMSTKGGASVGPYGGTVTLGAGGTITINSGVSLMNLAPGAGSAPVSTFNILGANVTSNGNFTSAGTAGSSTLVLNGGLLNLTGHTIGAAAASNQVNFNLQAGTLANLGEFNGGATTLTKTTTGTVTVDGVNTFTAPTLVSAGTLLVRGSMAGNVTVTNGATLGGGVGAAAGTVGGAVTLSGGGTLSPGSNGTSTVAAAGVLNVAGLAMSGGTNATFLVDITANAPGGGGLANAGVGYDQVVATGTNTVSFGGAALKLQDALFASTAPSDFGDRFVILRNLGGTNATDLTFAGAALAEGQTFTGPNGVQYQINYNVADANGVGADVVLTNATPEPTALGLMGLAAAGLMRRNRRRRA